ncbi:MAG: hypothetical protein MUC95_06620, partial [Spirochaetes bacterium]|nr:hypothetical protein [Spirochaetota bacterium]
KLNAILKDDDQNKSPYLKNIPEKLSNYADYYRELEVAKTIYKTLLGLYEQSKLEEAKEGIYVQVIDPAVVPDEKIKPKRAIMVIVAAVASFILSIFIVFFKEWLKDLKLNIPTNQRI